VSSTTPPGAARSTSAGSAWELRGGAARDLRQAWRSLRRRPGHTAVAVVTMALGIGATTVLFSVANGVLLKPLPFPESERLVTLAETRQGGTNRIAGILTNGTYLAWRDEPATLEGLAGWALGRRTLSDAGGPERLLLAEVTPSLFPLLRSGAALGRVFAPGEEQERLIVLSHALWRDRYGADREVIGELIRLDDEAFRVIGVMPAGFAFPDRDIQAWLPFHVAPVEVTEGGGGSLSMFRALGRLRPGATPQQAAAEGTARGRGAPDPGMVIMAVFGSQGPVEVTATPWLDSITAEVRPAILILLAAVGLLLVTATANVASLQLAAASARRREVAVRAALGARGGQLARHLLVESGLLGLLGGAAGLALAAGLLRSAPRLLPESFPRLDAVALDLPVLLFALGLSVASGLVFGLAPLRHARRVDLRSALVGGDDAVASAGRRPLGGPRALVMAGQVAIACVLLIGASLLGRSFLALLDADLGYDPENVLTGRLVMPEHAIAEERRSEILDATVARLRSMEGVRAAAVANLLPLTSGESLMSFTMPTAEDPEATVHAAVRTVGPGYFEALGLRIAEGRGLSETDTATAPPAVVVNRAFARRYLGERPVGAELPLQRGEDGPHYRVVGVFEDVRRQGAADEAIPELVFCHQQRPGGFGSSEAYLVARTTGDPAALVPTLRAIVREQDASAVVESVMTMEDRVWSSLAQPRLNALLVGGFALFALAIAAAGLFGVLSYSVAQRAREIGVRGALGATSSDIVRLVLGQGLRIAVPGMAGGLIASFWLVQALSGLLYGTAPRDPLSFVLVPLALVAVALVSFAVPARRAAQIDPQKVLRAS
jgi:putative ABC transport system permease protein